MTSFIKRIITFIRTIVSPMLKLTRSGVSTAAVACALFMAPLATAATAIVRVDGANGSLTTANPAPDGSGWEADAFLYLQDAIEHAQVLLGGQNPPTDVQIWVLGSTSGGGQTYYPDRNTGNPTGSGARAASFTLHANVSIRKLGTVTYLLTRASAIGSLSACPESLESSCPASRIM